MGIQSGQALAVVANFPLRWGFKAQQKLQKGGFSAAGRPDDRDVLSGMNLQGNVIQHISGLRAVAEAHVLQFNTAAQRLDDLLLLVILRLGVKNWLQACVYRFQAEYRHTAAYQLHQRRGEGPEGGIKGHEITNGNILIFLDDYKIQNHGEQIGRNVGQNFRNYCDPFSLNFVFLLLRKRNQVFQNSPFFRTGHTDLVHAAQILIQLRDSLAAGICL